MDRKKQKEIRLLMYLCQKYDIVSTAKKYFEINKIPINNYSDDYIKKKFEQHLFGKINYFVNVRGHHDIKYGKIRKDFNDIFDLKFKVDEIVDIDTKIKNNTLPIENDNGTGTCFVLKGIGIITACHVLYKREKENLEFYSNAKIICNDKEIEIKEEDVLRKDYSKDYAIVKIDVVPNLCNMGFDYDENFAHNDTVYFAGFPDYVSGNDITIDTAKIICKMQKSVVGFVSTISGNIIQGMSGGPIINDKSNVIGYIVEGQNLEEFYTKKITRPNGFKDIKGILNDL